MNGINLDWPAPENVNAWSTSRNGGCSKPPFDRMNLAHHVNDIEHDVIQNRKILRETLALPTEPCWLNQTHSIEVINVGSQDSDCQADGSYTRQSGVVCVVMTADCLPVLLCDKKGTVVAAVHAGWRGLLNGILNVAIKKLDTPGNELLAWLGPAIGPQAFEVKDDVRDAYIKKDDKTTSAFSLKSTTNSQRTWLADIYQLAESQLKNSGIEQIYGKKWCTYKENSQFYSYRRDGITGRMASLIWLS